MSKGRWIKGKIQIKFCRQYNQLNQTQSMWLIFSFIDLTGMKDKNVLNWECEKQEGHGAM